MQVTVPIYSLFAYRRGDETVADLTRRGVPEWNLTKAIRWALEKNCDTLIVELTGTAKARPGVTHHLCNDPKCPGGCE